jgi:hypothetical protein
MIAIYSERIFLENYLLIQEKWRLIIVETPFFKVNKNDVMNYFIYSKLTITAFDFVPLLNCLIIPLRL